MSYDTLSEVEWDQVDRIWDLLEEGELERARIEVESLLRKRPGHPDLRILEAAIALDSDDPQRALETLAHAERSADPAQFFHIRGRARYELAQFEEARADGERALAIHLGYAQAHDLLARVLDHLGEGAGAREHAEAAHEIDPEGFPLPLDVPDGEFDALVERSLAELTGPVRAKLDELPVIVQALPSRAMLAEEKPPISPDLLGLFVGRHLLERSHADLPATPGAIYLFRCNLLRTCADREELAREVRITVQHEVGHLLGLDEDDLEQWGLA